MGRNRIIVALLSLLLLDATVARVPLRAEEGRGQNLQTVAPDPLAAIQAKIDELQQRIKLFADSETEEVAQGLNVSLEQLRERTETLQETQNYYTQQLQALHKHDSLQQEQEALQDGIASGEALKLAEEPPYSLKFYDDYNARYADSKRNRDTAQLAVAVAENNLQDARDRLNTASAQVRALKEVDEKGKDPREVLLSQWQQKKAEREEALATAVLGYQQQVLENSRKEAELAEIKVDLARQISERIRENLHFDQGDLDKQLEAIEAGKKEVLAEVEENRRELRRAGREVLKAQRQMQRSSGDKELAKAKAGLAVAEQWQQVYRIRLEQAESVLQQMGIRKQLWKQRYDLIKEDGKRSDLTGLRETAIKQRDRLQQTISLEQERQTSLQLQIGKLEEQLMQEGLGWNAKGNLSEQRQALVDLVDSTINFLSVLNKTAQMNQQFIEELDRALQSFSLRETFSLVFTKLQGWWNAELLVVDNQALTVRKIVISFAILVFGIIITSFFSRYLHGRLQANFRLSTSTAAITSKLIHYTMVLVVIFFAMRIVNIPLTAFTFMGGAIALGVGFGAQKLINNFISGFIIMAEQPIKVGDLIMMDNEPGWIEDIGARSTRVRTYANINILVPNSYFLENNIINWTHNDNLVRGRVVVGVAYGSPTREVKEALLRAAAAHGEVRQEPEPYVWFADFGDNALIFELYFWVMVTEHGGIQRVASDLRFMIDQQFREANLTIAFPQRDIHFDRGNPLRVEISRPHR